MHDVAFAFHFGTLHPNAQPNAILVTAPGI
jgi:hypothetical protein